MAVTSPAPTGSGASSAHNLQLSASERLAFAHYFSLADPANSGIVQGSAAVPFFAKARLAPPVLGQIWSIADSANNGFLTAPTFSVALRLIGHAQRGETPDESLISRPGAPPVLEGIQLPNFPVGTPMSPQRTGSAQTPAVEIKPDDRARYTRIFATAGPVGGMLDGEKAKEIFVKSRLPFDKLGAIWNLADTKARGALDLTDFIIGMHFIQGSMSGSIVSLPATLPQGLYEAAAGLSSSTIPSSPMRAQATGNSVVPRQLTGQQHPGLPPTTLSPTHTGNRGMSMSGNLGSPALGSGLLGPQRTGMGASGVFGAPASQWGVSADSKAKADRFFDGLDAAKKGVLDGQTVVPFFMQSKLSEQTLANIWDLSDITQTGFLSRDEFAVAMHLINAALTGVDVPLELPADLVPPSLRGQKLPDAVNPQQTDTQKDLFSLMDDDDAPTSLPISAASAFVAPTAGAPLAAGVSPAPPSRSAITSPFEDDDFFGGSSQPKPASSIPKSAAPASSSQLPQDQSAEFGNKTLQLNSTEKAVADLQSRRNDLESGVAQGAASLAELETRLSTVRSSHETESRLVKDLQARKEKQAAELKTVREELITSESELSRLKGEKDEIEQQVMHDREEIRSTKKHLSEVQTELTALKSEVEKLKKDARQQKGMVAISKKQLSTAEGEMEKLRTEKGDHLAAAANKGDHDAAATDLGAVGGDHPDVIETATVPGGLEAMRSPAASVRSNNPFDRFKTVSPAPVQSSDSATSPSLSSAAIGGAASAGGVAAAIGLGATPRGEDASTQSATNVSRDIQEDPWSKPTLSQSPVQHVPATQTTSHDAFDDAFGDDFAPSATSPPKASNDNSAAFDDAFGDFDDPPTTAAGTDTTSSVDNIEDLPSRDRYAASASETVSDDDALPITGANKGKAAARDADTDADDSLSSGDDDEGPEDLERERGAYRGYSSASHDPSVGNTESGAAGLTSSAMLHSDATTRAEEKFPELPSDATLASQVTPVGSAGIGQDLVSSGLSKEPGSTLSSSASDAISSGTGVYGSGPVRSQDTGASDAFVDAPTGDFNTPLSYNDALSSTSAAISASRPTLAEATDSTRSLAGSASSDAATNLRPESPSSSLKTRRAAPPPPKRSTSGSTTVTTATAVPPDTTSGQAPQVSTSSSNTPFDDFEASFADLGPVKEATGYRSTAPSGTGDSTGTGFDDAFDDDAEFDFVPSFANTAGQPDAPSVATQGGPGLPQQSGATAPTAAPADAAFGGFDDAFGTEPAVPPAPPVRSTGGSAAPPINFGMFGSGGVSSPARYGSRSATGGNNSNSGGTDSSAFSFEDAFAPATGDTGAATTEPTPASNGYFYAPPPGSPPSETSVAPASGRSNVPPAPSATSGLAVPADATNRSGVPAASARHSPALADDAGPVRQLAGMGFPRHKVIAALEKSNYRVEKALERLLAES